MKPDKILKILSDNGFDWFGNPRYLSYEFENKRYLPALKIAVVGTTKNNNWIRKSLADLATNKSFLEAMQKVRKERRTGNLCISVPNNLISDLIEYDGKNFWEICSLFMGVNDEN